MIKSSYALIISLFLLAACSDSKEETEKPVSPRVKKSTKIERPSQSESFTRGEEIPVRISSDDVKIDSIQVTIDDETQTFLTSEFNLGVPSRRVGSKRILVKVFCGEESETHYRKVTILSENEPETYTYQVERELPHAVEDYTQGLLIHDGVLYESTGQRGESSVKKKQLETGAMIKAHNLGADFFGEGLAFHDNKLFQLTWTSGKAFVYDLDLNQTATFNYSSQGWGLTSYKKHLIMTDGSEKLFFVDPNSFTVVNELEVYDNEGKQEALNELEVIDDVLYANVYQEDYILAIDLATGEVLRKIDMTGLLSAEESEEADVLNGIAYDTETLKIYVTGKWWPKLFEVTFEPKTLQ